MNTDSKLALKCSAAAPAESDIRVHPCPSVVEPLQCRSMIAGEVQAAAPSVIMWMPAGSHSITPSQGGKAIAITVQVDRSTAAAAQLALDAHVNAGKRPFFDFNHEEREASAWPVEFFWAEAPEPGVYARVEWSKPGAEAITGKSFRGFSPSFFVGKERPAKVTGSPLCMGGLVNDPAFNKILPLWAKNNGATAPTPNTKPKASPMTPEEIAALQAKQAKLEQENAELKAKAASAETTEAIEAKDAEIKALQAKVEAADAAIKAQQAKDAKEAVKAAVARGALPPQNTELHAKWEAAILADPASVVLLAGIQPPAAITAGRTTSAQVVSDDVANVIKAYSAEQDPMARGRIYAGGLRARMDDNWEHVVRAANTLGTVTGTLVTQRALDLLKYQFPMLTRITTDFSTENAALNQAIVTRTLSAPAIGTYHVDNGYVSAAKVDADITVTIDSHKFAQYEFTANDLASTRRLLFGESEPTLHYTLGKDLVDALYALITATYTSKVTEAAVDVDRATLIELGRVMTVTNKMPPFGRTLLLNSTAYAKLCEDTVIVSNLYNGGAGAAITKGVLPEIHGLTPIEAPNLPSTTNLQGFGFTRGALCLATRLPNDYATAVPGANGGGVTTVVTNPDTGFSVQKVEFIDHYLGRSYIRLAWMYGVARGQLLEGVRLVTA
jgi:hypothetical protein